MMHTKDMLANELTEVGLLSMANAARAGYYHDFLSPLATPGMQLCADLAMMAEGTPNREAILALRQRVINGDFDASQEESDDWAGSPEGQEAFQSLIGKGR
jgi:hypothetical protein